MNISYTWQPLDNIQQVASTFLEESGFTNTSDLIGQILAVNYPVVIDPLGARQRPDGSWTSGIIPGTVIIIPGV